jgi:hypothetical protein
MDIPETEQAMIEALERGETVVVNVRKWGHSHVITWAMQRNLFQYIGRDCGKYAESPWHNPFKEGIHGDRQEVIEQYAVYVQGQPELLSALPLLRGKALGCWCAPKPCHGDVLLELLKEGEGSQNA